MKKIIMSFASFLLVPALAFAQNFNYVTNVTGFIKTILGWVIPIIITILVIVFLYEIYQFISAPPDEKTKRRSGVLYSILALFIAISIFGIISIMQRITGTQGVNTLDSNSIPKVQW